jgi:DNA-binding MarR family transcriptional regulator
MEEALARELSDAVFHFTRYFLCHINHLLHRLTFRGRRFSESEVIALIALGVARRMTPGEISRVIDVPKGSLTLILRRLCAQGLARRVEPPVDGRSYQLALTAEGRRFVAFAARQRQAGLGALFRDLAPGDARAAARGLRVIAGHLRHLEESHAVRVGEQRR